MNAKHWTTLELPKVLARLAKYTSFSAGHERALALAPSPDPDTVARWQRETSEARRLLTSKADLNLGGVHDVRPLAEAASRNGTLLPQELLDVRSTLIAARELRRTLTRLDNPFPSLAAVAGRIADLPGLINEIGRCIDAERAEVYDHASPALAAVRRDLRGAFGNLQEKLQRILTNPRNGPYLQEALLTQRGGRYVIPIKAEFKGRIPGIVHDQSASGATLFIEPLSTVELNNKWRELQLKEEREVQKVLHDLSQIVGAEAAPIARTVEALAEIDVIFARARYADATRSVEPALRAPPVIPPAERGGQRGGAPSGGPVALKQARHPLLDPSTVVPLDIVLDEDTRIVVITGPNTGGKTVALKTVGLIASMAQCGMHIPAAEGSALAIFDQIFADIGDEQSIEQSLSTFSSHLTNITSFLDEVDDRSLVLLDELGAGTDPAEGSALARAMLDHLRARQAVTLVATHYPELKVWAAARHTPGAVNASVEFDAETLRPTYKLTIGLPGRSNAFAIATRLGLPDEIVSRARSMVAEGDLRAEDLLADIHRQRELAESARRAAEAARAEAERQARELRDRLAKIEDERAAILDRARDDAAQQLAALSEEVDALRKRLSAAQQAELEAVRARAAELEAKIEPERPADTQHATRNTSHAIRVGDTVWVRPVNATGEVLSIAGREAEIGVGAARMRAKLGDLEWRSSPAPGVGRAGQTTVHLSTRPKLDLDLRGLRADEAIRELEKHVEAAYLAGMPFTRIIHGKGTGSLRKAVREALRDNPVVSAIESGQEGEGGDGVTVVRLVEG
ncbi:MAG TPA: endonuclease MutS2 [Anaerolineae bacterium]|nr:endonuclease MutS2 [Anaerolineae bacterium]